MLDIFQEIRMLKEKVSNIVSNGTGGGTPQDLSGYLQSSDITITKQSNTFNGLSQLVKTRSDGKLPAIDGSLLINLPNQPNVNGSIDKLGYYNIITDYSADNTGVNDATTAINNAITAAIPSKGSVYIPKGTYKIAGTIHWNTYVNLIGENWASTILKSSTATTMLDCNGQTTISEHTASISNIQFDGNSIGTTCLDLRFQITFQHHHLYVHHFMGVSTKLTGCIAGEFNTCHWLMNINGAIQGVKGTDTINGNMQPNAMLFSHCLINYTTNAFAVDWSDSAGLYFTNDCIIENNGTNGNANTGFLNYSNGSPTGEGIGFVLENCWAEINKGTFIKMNNVLSETRSIIFNTIVKFGTLNYVVNLTGDNGNKNVISIINSSIGGATTGVYATGTNASVEIQNSSISSFAMFNGATYYQYIPTLITTGSGTGVNLLTNPRALNLWTNNAVTMTANATTSADGTTNADKMAATTASAVHFVNQLITKAASAITYTVGIDVKPSNVSLFEVNVTTSTNNGVIGKYNVTTGAVVAAPVSYGSGFTVGSSSITALPNGFYRIQITLTTNTETNLGVYYALSGTFAGNGTDGVFLDNASLT